MSATHANSGGKEKSLKFEIPAIITITSVLTINLYKLMMVMDRLCVCDFNLIFISFVVHPFR